MNIIQRALYKGEDYTYPDHYDEDVYWHALESLCQPTPWRSWVPMWLRRWIEG